MPPAPEIKRAPQSAITGTEILPTACKKGISSPHNSKTDCSSKVGLQLARQARRGTSQPVYIAWICREVQNEKAHLLHALLREIQKGGRLRIGDALRGRSTRLGRD